MRDQSKEYKLNNRPNILEATKYLAEVAVLFDDRAHFIY